MEKKLFDLKTGKSSGKLTIIESRFNNESGYYSHFVKQSEILPSGLEISRYTWVRSRSENPDLENKKITYIFQSGYPIIFSEGEDLEKSATSQAVIKEGRMAVDKQNRPIYFRSVIVDKDEEGVDDTLVETSTETYIPSGIKELITNGLTYIHPLFE